jgi:hypothetical protein
MRDDRTKADKAWEARQEAARYRIFNAATNAAEATDEADDENYFAVLDQAGNAAETAAAEITGLQDLRRPVRGVGHTPQTVLARRTRRASASCRTCCGGSAGNALNQRGMSDFGDINVKPCHVCFGGVKRTSQIRPVMAASDNHWLGVCRVCCAAFSMT